MSDFFSRVWNAEPFEVDLDAWPDLKGPCQFAVVFQAWIDVLFNKHLEGADLVRLHQLLLQVQRRFFELHARLPDEHRYEDGREPDHHCVFSVYKAAVDLLHERRDDLDPPPVVLPPAPLPEQKPKKPKKPRSRLDALLFGDEDEPDPEFGP